MHMEENGFALRGREPKAANASENGNRTATVSVDTVRKGTVGRTYIVKERSDNDALTGKVAAVGEGVAAGLEGVLRKPARPAVVRMTAAAEEVALKEVFDSAADSFAARLPKEGENLGFNGSRGHMKNVSFFLYCGNGKSLQ